MRDGLEVFEDLRQFAWVDPSVEYESVIAGLARGERAVNLLASDRGQANHMVRFTGNEAHLIEELTSIARAPFAATPPPSEPRIELSRIVHDFESTTRRRLTLDLRWEQFSDRGQWICEVAIDGRSTGSIGRAFEEDEESLAEVADALCEHSLHEEVWGGWPMCPRHPHSPMWARVTPDGIASWVCQADPNDALPIGSLSEPPPR